MYNDLCQLLVLFVTICKNNQFNQYHNKIAIFYL